MNVLLVRADGIGDALVCAPLVEALRDAGHTVGAVLGTKNASIYARRAFCAVHVLERIPWPRHGSTPQSRAAALGEVRAARYDVALVASEELEAYRFASDAGVSRRIGFVNGWEKPFKSALVRALVTQTVMRPASAARSREHEVETIFRLGRSLVSRREPTRDLDRLRALVLDLPPHDHGCVVLQLSAKATSYGLDATAFVSIARALLVRGIASIVTGDDATAVEGVARAAGAQARANLDLFAWKATIAGARAVVTADSGAAHVAGMTGVPCVDCFPASAVVTRDVARWHPWASRYRAVVLGRERTAAEISGSIVRALAEVAG